MRQAALDGPGLHVADANIAIAWSALGPVYEQLGRFDSAETVYTKALRMFDGDLPREDGRVVRALANLIMFLVRTNQLGKAEQLLPRCREAAGFQPPGIQTAWALNAIGTLLVRAGHLQDAETAFNEALSLERSTTEDRILRGQARANLAAVFIATSRAAEARQVFELVLLDEQHRVGPMIRQLVPTLSGLAASCQSSGDHAAAARHLERAIAIAARSLSEDYRVRADLLAQDAQVLRTLHRNREAKDAGKQGRDAARQAEHVQTANQVVHVSESGAQSTSVPH